MTPIQIAAGISILIVVTGCLHAFFSSSITSSSSKKLHTWLIVLAIVLLLFVGLLTWFSSLPAAVSFAAPATQQTACTPAFIEKVLERANSPARGQGVGDEMYRRGMQYHIEPCWSLGFFHHESNYGKAGVAYTTHSIGNIRCTPDWPKCINGFKFYPTWADSVDDWFKLIDAYRADGLDTLPKIIHRYAPDSDGNNESAYVKAVEADLASWSQASR